MKKAACYARVSTADQELGTQVKQMKNYCVGVGWEAVVFEENASGKEGSRTQLDLLMQRLRQGEFDALIVAKLDRLGRSLKHLLQIIQELENRKVQFISLSEGFDTATPQGRFFFQIAGSFAEFERALISERTKTALAFLKSEGKTIGRPKGALDKKPRRKSGYWLRWTREKDSKKLNA